MQGGGDAVLRRKGSDQVPLEQAPSARLRHVRGRALWQVLLSTSCPHLLLWFHAVYCSSVSFTIFSESARFAFQVLQYLSCQVWQTVLILVCILLADQFYVEFKWHSDFKSDSNPCSRGIVNRRCGSGRWILKYFYRIPCQVKMCLSLPVTLYFSP